MFLRHNFFGLIWALAIFFMCVLPGNTLPDVSFWSLLSFDKVVHAFMFATLTILLIVGFIKQQTLPILHYKALIIVPIACIGYGGVLEVVQQSLISGRSGEIIDLVADSIGSLFGVAWFYIVYGKNTYMRKI